MRSGTTPPATSTRPTGYQRSLATQPAPATRPTVLMRSITTPVAATRPAAFPPVANTAATRTRPSAIVRSSTTQPDHSMSHWGVMPALTSRQAATTSTSATQALLESPTQSESARSESKSHVYRRHPWDYHCKRQCRSSRNRFGRSARYGQFFAPFQRRNKADGQQQRSHSGIEASNLSLQDRQAEYSAVWINRRGSS